MLPLPRRRQDQILTRHMVLESVVSVRRERATLCSLVRRGTSTDGLGRESGASRGGEQREVQRYTDSVTSCE